jgi:STE24 endopeptidase
VVGLLGFYILSKLMLMPDFYAAFNVKASAHAALTLFMIFGDMIGFWLSPFFNGLSRHNEYDADRFSVQVSGLPEALKTALIKLARENLSHLTPHPLYSFFHYSHPTLGERLKSIETAMKQNARVHESASQISQTASSQSA